MSETNLAKLIYSMSPARVRGEFVFCTISENEHAQAHLKSLMVFRENEGITLLLPKGAADALSIPYSGTWALIDCQIDRNLFAVGFLAAISWRLASSNIPLNVVPGYYHDHVLIPTEHATEAMKLLKELSKEMA